MQISKLIFKGVQPYAITHLLTYVKPLLKDMDDSAARFGTAELGANNVKSIREADDIDPPQWRNGFVIICDDDTTYVVFDVYCIGYIK